ncbi:MAG: M23 family metallopeptidase [Elusimicrobia bacterium]|nr:M23 family metallopeptidase [Elusimicrobiota bacterium]
MKALEKAAAAAFVLLASYSRAEKPAKEFEEKLVFPGAIQETVHKLKLGEKPKPSEPVSADPEVAFARDFHPAYRRLATGRIDKILDQRLAENGPGRARARYDWPVEVKSIGHTIASYQHYNNDGKPYFHGGLDIRADAGSPVKASAGGTILFLNNYSSHPLMWSVGIKDADGFIWEYGHIDGRSIPDELFRAFKSLRSIPAGTFLGNVCRWTVDSFGEPFHHIHLNVVAADNIRMNPFLFLKPLDDGSAPEIMEMALLKKNERLQGYEVSGDYSIMAHVRDRVLHNKFYVPPNETTFSIDGGPPQLVWHFDTVPDRTYIHDFFVPGQACGDYECRRPIINLGFKRGKRASRFPRTPGKHRLTLTVKDDALNAATKTFFWTVLPEAGANP